MRKMLSVLVYGVAFVICMPIGYSMVAADWLESVADFGVGYRLDHFDWGIRRPITDPFPGVEWVDVEWKDLQILDVMASVKLTACDLIYWRINADWGTIFLGKNYFTSFEGPVPTIAARAHNNADGRWVFDTTTGVGFHIGNRETCVQVSPMVGYSVHGQKLFINDGVTTIGQTPAPCHLHVEYLAIWDGPWLGADIEIDTYCPGLHLVGSAEWHWARYKGYGCWKREGPEDNPLIARRYCMDYRDTARATGYVFVAGLSYSTTGTWAFGLMGTLQHFRTTRHGLSNRHVINHFTSNLTPAQLLVDALPTEPCQTMLKVIDWKSISILFTFDTYF